MRLTIVKDDNQVIVDGYGIQFDLTPFELDTNLWAVQWYDDHGEIEFRDGSPNEVINSISDYQDILDEHTRLKHDKENPPPPTESEKFTRLKEERDSYISQSDWLIQRHRDQEEINCDSNLSYTEYNEVQEWRQALRDLPQIYKTSDEWEWPEVPQAVHRDVFGAQTKPV